MEEFTDAASYVEACKNRSELPKGFLASSVPLSFYPKEKKTGKPLVMNVSSVLLSRPTPVFAGVFTKNKSPGAPVSIGREMLHAETARGVLINNKIANVCAPGGKNAALRVVKTFAQALGCCSDGNREKEVIFPSSTGVIGWELPVEAMEAGVKDLAAVMCSKSKEKLGSMYSVAEGIMTTDAFAKVRSAECCGGRIVAAAKGAGMIEPNMGTLLVFIVTDLTISREYCREVLPRVMEKSFNCISIDGDQSTSDTALMFSSCRVEDADEAEFETQLTSVCMKLAEDTVRNGEGTSHVIRVTVQGAESAESAKGFGKAIINSPLVKTAVFGNDPNVGRIIMALGDFAGNNGFPFHSEVTKISIGEIPVFRDGVFLLNDEKEAMLNSYFQRCALGEAKNYPPHERTVDITVDLNCGTGGGMVFGSDLSYEYVRENADYRT